ncbi:hypothetical protein E2562_036934 [Oryza meyeriana var. granulata]|uniref:Uncharacterized protein n=1 Tax=Oryza meyeriana var. granulata TaxID=110450 RepID=A0A6G1FGJ0_9ORYZ|nr:hypothetical protein E2562_036934 [Oryza meyeriana var. granulata]KAF0935944.1 hypothetical protein E2562_036934 [Oryza meyeriana var. granulata]
MDPTHNSNTRSQGSSAMPPPSPPRYHFTLRETPCTSFLTARQYRSFIAKKSAAPVPAPPAVPAPAPPTVLAPPPQDTPAEPQRTPSHASSSWGDSVELLTSVSTPQE